MEKMTLAEASSLLKPFGMDQEEIYLVDLVLLAQMAWADDVIQDAERDILFGYLAEHVASINKMAGYTILPQDKAFAFMEKLLTEKPSEQFLATIHKVIPAVCAHHKNKKDAMEKREAVLHACLDIAASSVTEYPYGLRDRFSAEEKATYQKIASLFGVESSG